MAQKTPVSGQVVAISSERKTFKVGDKWYRISDRASGDLGLPERGATISFDAYGPQQDSVYRYMVQGELGNGNGASGADSSAGVPARSQVRSDRGAADSGGSAPRGTPRGTALIAAATLLQGSEGNVEQVASNAVTVARIFEVYLSGQTPKSVEDEEML